MWKWLLGLFVISVVACGTGGFFLTRSEKFNEFLESMRPGEKPLEVRLGKVERGTLIRTVNAPGSIEPKTKVQISAQVVARITALPFREGDTVKKGDVVVRLDARDLAAALESAQAAQRGEESRLEGAQASFARAETELKRQRDLAKTGDASKSTLENAESDFLRAKSAMEASQHSIDIARANVTRAQRDLENTEIRSPFDGIITKLYAEEGELVLVGTLNNAASVIMEIADLEAMLLKARVDETNIAPVKAGQKAKVYVNAYRTRTFEGVVDRVGLKRQIDKDGTGYYEVEIIVKKPEGELLPSGLTSNTDIEVESLYDVNMLPSQAVLDRRIDDLPKTLVEGSTVIEKNKAYARVVYKMVEGFAKPVLVSVGSSDLTHTVILAGLNEGEQVIVGPFRALVDLKQDRKVAEEGTLKKKDTAQPKPQASVKAEMN